jgi:hypothetical protein
VSDAEGTALSLSKGPLAATRRAKEIGVYATGGGINKTRTLKKLRGCIAASPIVPFGFVLTSFSWLSFLQPFYSPPNLLKFTPALLAERVFNLMYSDTDLSCQEESEVSDEKK